MPDTISLRVLGFVNKGVFHLVCLETDIVVRDENFADAKGKMTDALISYFKSFTMEEMEAGSYKRRAPLRYRCYWRIGSIVNHLIHTFSVIESTNADYHPHSGALSLA